MASIDEALTCNRSFFLKGTSDKLLGGSMLLAAAVVFTYYTMWAMLLPFFDPTSEIHAYFPSREWAVRIPAFILVVGISAIGAFVGSTVLKEQRKRAKQARMRAA
ncbi:Dolichol phosphate-mannose biosynthesis regulatory protein [Mycena indigotica]|uniref:Dolichol phosphate-mannose biosynthesis regulatory protein n=1 Tax=Mycena indigotica TaxID=2126181 RepID=A0A8H6VWX6_9AGAR|nr:Dolichol phosphate-mannose biosynthesis regulatory protein [Mycena indigotica]KAF7294901.1 Dolichol phosphate-mannose biosynthesis regulatory protein [Mycena indigotica]